MTDPAKLKERSFSELFHERDIVLMFGVFNTSIWTFARDEAMPMFAELGAPVDMFRPYPGHEGWNVLLQRPPTASRAYASMLAASTAQAADQRGLRVTFADGEPGEPAEPGDRVH